MEGPALIGATFERHRACNRRWRSRNEIRQYKRDKAHETKNCRQSFEQMPTIKPEHGVPFSQPRLRRQRPANGAACSLDHRVGAGENRGRQRKAKCLGRSCVHHQLDSSSAQQTLEALQATKCRFPALSDARDTPISWTTSETDIVWPCAVVEKAELPPWISISAMRTLPVRS